MNLPRHSHLGAERVRDDPCCCESDANDLLRTSVGEAVLWRACDVTPVTWLRRSSLRRRVFVRFSSTWRRGETSFRWARAALTPASLPPFAFSLLLVFVLAATLDGFSGLTVSLQPAAASDMFCSSCKLLLTCPDSWPVWPTSWPFSSLGLLGFLAAHSVEWLSVWRSLFFRGVLKSFRFLGSFEALACSFSAFSCLAFTSDGSYRWARPKSTREYLKHTCITSRSNTWNKTVKMLFRTC